jgi:hypothetical protein
VKMMVMKFKGIKRMVLEIQSETNLSSKGDRNHRVFTCEVPFQVPVRGRCEIQHAATSATVAWIFWEDAW